MTIERLKMTPFPPEDYLYTAAEVAELKAQCAAMLEKAAAPLYKALMAICEFHGGCYCGECKLDGSQDFLCIETREAIEEYRSLIPTDAAQALEEVKRQARLEEVEWFADNVEYSESSGRLVEQRLAALHAEGAKQP